MTILDMETIARYLFHGRCMFKNTIKDITKELRDCE
jgi:hypothetical protein